MRRQCASARSSGVTVAHLLYLSHELLSLLILAGHDVGHAQVGQHNGSDIQQVRSVFLDNWLVVVDGLGGGG